jgi:predicted RND superfamily exporter protein
MLNYFYLLPIRFPKSTLLLMAAFTVLALAAMSGLRWETDARVYFPKGHPAIEFDERVADVFGVKDSIVIGIVNEKGVFNTETLARVARITEKVTAMPSVLNRTRLDVASLSSATVFVGSDTELSNDRVMEQVPEDEQALAELKRRVYANADLFVGNLVSADGTATMIRAQLKEGKDHRYQAYFQVKAILAAELGGGSAGKGAWSGNEWSGNQWSAGGDKNKAADKGDEAKAGNADDGSTSADKESAGDDDWQAGGGWGGGNWLSNISDQAAENGDRFYIAGRPVIEVTSGLNALDDLSLMIPLLVLAIAVALFLIFRTVRGMVLPMLVVAVSIIWTMGAMAAIDIPMYTISTMLPVILVAVGIGDGIHLMSHYEDLVLEDPHRDRRDIVAQLMQTLGMPLLITTVTTAVGFLSLWWADMPPFRVFGVFTALGIIFCWLTSVMVVPAMLALMQPHASGYLKRRRSMRLHDETGPLTRGLVATARKLMAHRQLATVLLLGIIVGVGLGARYLYVDSSWIADFRKDSEVAKANDMFNKKFDGTIFLNVVVDGRENDALKSPELLAKIELLQARIEELNTVGSSLSLVDYLKSTNKTLHGGDEAFNRLPDDRNIISEYMFLLSVSGRPEQLDMIVDYGYRQANVTFVINTDHTQALMAIIDQVNAIVAAEFSDMNVDVNLAGSANNSAVWADLLIKSQTLAIVLSKIGILVVAILLFRSFVAGFYTVLPVTVTTLLIAGMAGWLGIPLDVSTVLAAGVAIGVGVDYAVHYIFRYRYEMQRGMAGRDASLGAVRSVGKAVVLNAVVVTVGFMVLGLSQFPPHVKLGYFVSAYMVVACLAALLLLPLAFAWLQPRFSGGRNVQGKSAT